MSWDLRQPLPGALLIALVHAPFVYEVALQLRLAARLYALLPPAIRQSFPNAPATEAWLFLAPPGFQRAFWRYVMAADVDGADVDGASAEIVRLRRALRRSLRRKIVVATLGFAVALGLVMAGWRPYPT